MDLTFNERELAFRDELRGWLAENKPDARPDNDEDDAGYQWRRDWQRNRSGGGDGLRRGWSRNDRFGSHRGRRFSREGFRRFRGRDLLNFDAAAFVNVFLQAEAQKGLKRSLHHIGSVL
jgi:hypothetical protein